MRREELEHLLRAASQIAGEPNVLVIGSQSILGSRDESALPAVAVASMEADIAFFDDPGDAKADLVDGAIGELSPFHDTFGYYAQGVGTRTATLPWGGATGWSSSRALRPDLLADCVSSRMTA